MGRTFRIRNSKRKVIEENHLSPELDSEMICLNKYLKRKLMKKLKKFKLHSFPDTGRGVKALEKISPGDVLMEIPFNLILNMYTLESDVNFKNLFSSIDFENKKAVYFSCQQLLAFYISFIKISPHDDLWSNYLKTIPCNFSVPYFSDYKRFISDVQNIVKGQEIEIVHSYKNLCNVLKNNLNEIFPINLFTLDLYAWSYFAVNSRCVYLKPDIVINEIKLLKSKDKFSFLNIIDGDPNLGLIPFLDLFNHSPLAKTDIFFDYVPGEKEPLYKLISLSEFQKHSQIFIMYGEHTNLKLFTEYGFCFRSNPFSKINIDSTEIVNFPNIVIDKDQYRYIKKHRLNTNLFIDVNGLSYNLIRVLFILSNIDKSNWDMKIYSAILDNEEMSVILKLVTPWALKRVSLYRDYLNENFEFDKYTIEANNILINEYLQFFSNIIDKS